MNTFFRQEKDNMEKKRKKIVFNEYFKKRVYEIFRLFK